MEHTDASFLASFHEFAEVGMTLDLTQMRVPDGFPAQMEPAIQQALEAMERLESGEIANPDEGRQVGHYWLREPRKAPEAAAQEIRATLSAVRLFAADVHAGRITTPCGSKFRNLLLIGIGGSALGPQLLADALGYVGQPMRPYFLDNTDPDGMARVLEEIGADLRETLTLVISKSGGTKETRNGMVVVEAAYRAQGLEFAPHAVAVTGVEGSSLREHAESRGWLRIFPMYEWVGGRTSVFSAVGLLPAALMGLDVTGLLAGARLMDEATRTRVTAHNPAALLALMWYLAGDGRGERDMVVLPYKDRLGLFARYLQQLVMESLGKELDLDGRRVNQGLVVYGNKGSTDQHAYVQQLREGADNFFAVFIEVRHDGGAAVEVDPGITSGDYLHGFLQGTRQALAENGRLSLTLSLDQLDAAALGKLIALFDRAVGLYASLIHINAYHQPGVEAGKKAAEAVIALQRRALAALAERNQALTAPELGRQMGLSQTETVTLYHLLRHLAANPGRGVRRQPGETPAQDRFAG